MISIIIPTLNEEKWLPLLLQDIKKQTFKDHEVIVADADSTDKTREIALSCGCKVIDGGLPAKGRNEGAKVAKGDIFVFMDADIRVKKDFLEKAYEEFQKRYIEIATCDYIPDTNEKDIKFLYNLYNEYTRTMQYFIPYSMGMFIIMTKRLFFRLNGFNESIKFGEDWDIANRAGKISKFRMLNSVHIVFSTRRIQKEGKFNYVAKTIKSNLYQLFVGNINKEGIVRYEFGHYGNGLDYKNKKKDINKRLRKLRKDLVIFKRKLDFNGERLSKKTKRRF